MTATSAGAQTDEAFAIPKAELQKEKPRLYRYEIDHELVNKVVRSSTEVP
jgi:hypothetical protein